MGDIASGYEEDIEALKEQVRLVQANANAKGQRAPRDAGEGHGGMQKVSFPSIAIGKDTDAHSRSICRGFRSSTTAPTV